MFVIRLFTGAGYPGIYPAPGYEVYSLFLCQFYCVKGSFTISIVGAVNQGGEGNPVDEKGRSWVKRAHAGAEGQERIRGQNHHPQKIGYIMFEVLEYLQGKGQKFSNLLETSIKDLGKIARN